MMVSITTVFFDLIGSKSSECSITGIHLQLSNWIPEIEYLQLNELKLLPLFPCRKSSITPPGALLRGGGGGLNREGGLKREGKLI